MDRKKIEDLTAIVLEKEVDKAIQKGDVNPIDVQNLTNAACLIEKLMKVNSRSMEDGDYSQRYYGRDMGNRNYNRYDRGNSYGRMDGYSRHSGEDLMMRKLQEALDEAHTESERQAIMEYMDQLKH